MGGEIPTHIGMALYSMRMIKEERASYNLISEECLANHPWATLSDIEYMSVAHILNLFFQILNNLIISSFLP